MDIAEMWRSHFSGVLDQRDLGEPCHDTVRGQRCYWYTCPCGQDNHRAYRPLGSEPGDVLTCFVTGQQWLIRQNVAGIIEDEERKYLNLLKNAPGVVRRVVADMGRGEDAMAYLKDTHGIDRELALEVMEEL